MTDGKSPIHNRRAATREDDAGDSARDARHPARKSTQYRSLKGEATVAVDALCERLVREFKSGIAEIDRTMDSIAGPLDDQLAKGAVSEVFEAAAETLKAQIRRRPDRSS